MLARFNLDGTLDDTFGSDGTVTTSVGSVDDRIYSIALQTDGKIVAAGFSKNASEYFDFTLARYYSTGSLDTNFGNSGIVVTDFTYGSGNYAARSVVIQPDGKIVAAGYFDFDFEVSGQFVVARYNEDGTLDDDFGTGGSLVSDLSPGRDWGRSVVLQPDGKIVVTGYSDFATENSNFALARFHPNGTLDSTFGIDGHMITDFFIDGKDLASSSVLQPDGKIVAAGYMYNGSDWCFALARYDEDGFLDYSFGVDGMNITCFDSPNAKALDVAIQPDGKIVAAGWMWNGTNADFAISRYNPDGFLDDSFGTNGQLTTDFDDGNNIATQIHIQPDGKIVATGSSGEAFSLARYLSELVIGVLDFSILNNSVWIYPNPVLENATLRFTLNQKESVSIQLVDLHGVTLTSFMENERLDVGEHYQAITLPNGLPTGVYFIVISTANGRVSIKIFK